MKKKNNFRVILFYVLLIAIIITVSTTLLGRVNVNKPKGYSEIVSAFKEKHVKSFKISENGTLTYETYEDGTFTYGLQSVKIFYDDLNDTILEQVETNKDKDIRNAKDGWGVFEYTYEEPTNYPWWVSYIPYLLMVGVFIFLWFFMMRSAAGGAGKMGSFGKAKVKVASDKDRKTFADVAGADEEKEELKEIVEFLHDPKKFTKLGAKIPHGVLLQGPPGTGKTLLAKAVAGEAGVPFFSISGSDFVEMYVGLGASRVRDLFEQARKTPASVVFIDEIDAVGRHRGAGLGGGHDEREQTLNQLLVEMDGFGTQDGVIVMAATNRPDILDPALLRPGRFDRQITVNYPDLVGREAILKVHARNKPFSEDVDFAKVAQTTAGFTGADIANLLNEAALLAARRGKMLIGMDDIEEASIKVMVGPQKKSMKLKDDEKRKTAYHEAGHAILAYVLPSQDPVRQISIIPSGRALGYTLNPPVNDKYSVYKNELCEKIVMLLGGRVAEKIIFDDISGGASNDIERATDIARKMVTELGMSEKLGPIKFGQGNGEVFLGRDFSNTPNYSNATAELIDEEIHSFVIQGYEKAEKLLRENMDKLHFIAEFLTKYETMDDVQFKTAMEQQEPTIEQIAAIAEAKKQAQAAENARLAKEAEQKRQSEQYNPSTSEVENKANPFMPFVDPSEMDDYNETTTQDDNEPSPQDEENESQEND